MRRSARHLKSLRRPWPRRSTCSRRGALLTCLAPQPDGSRPCVCAFPQCWRPCAPYARHSQNSMPCSTMSKKARFNALPSGEDQNEPERRRNLSVLCSERVSGISSVPIRRMELAARPDEVQRASLRALYDAIAQAGELLKTDCPTYRPITPVVRIDAMEQRLDAMLRAINIVQPALQKFYGSLTDEQKERFNRLAPVQG